MRTRIPCAICGNPTRRRLYRKLSIPLCSKKCEYLYLKNLSENTEEHALTVRYLDGEIKAYRTRNKLGWGVSGVAIVLILLGALLPEVNVFIVGAATAFVSAIATRHFEDKTKKLTVQRKKLVI